ncbi:MAG: 4-hydroxy-tetrahydrodipicolinate synthase [Pseudomonadota bacterium]|jgi:4-hydroxy-tetrahydrodipicolinate synthase|nr:4-hydroxy-tetrahydrodipicolinate synthase [Rhodospirillaceae bacterium]MEE2722387.1 4-hydroxy-tetrahydrodipicolinate synthase [Pseudomonadota bacterium]
MFSGSICALITPFRNGDLDEEAFGKLVDWQIGEGTHGLVPVGTTGESPTLSHDEHKRVVELCIDVADKRVPIIAGAGSNSTAEAIELTEHAMSAGADAALVVTPYYNKPTQEGLFRHFEALNDVGLPIIIYNIPGRSVIDMSVETMARCAELENVIGVKDATAAVNRATEQKMACGDDFCQLSGEDVTQLGFLAQGGVGCISVTANVAPKLMSEMHEAWRKGDIAGAQSINERLTPLHVDLFCEANPGPVKYGASLLGRCDEELRLPLVPINEESRGKVERAMRHAGLLN